MVFSRRATSNQSGETKCVIRSFVMSSGRTDGRTPFEFRTSRSLFSSKGLKGIILMIASLIARTLKVKIEASRAQPTCIRSTSLTMTVGAATQGRKRAHIYISLPTPVIFSFHFFLRQHSANRGHRTEMLHFLSPLLLMARENVVQSGVITRKCMMFRSHDSASLENAVSNTLFE